MTIERVIVKNYRALRDADVALQPTLNVIVGDNETGKSTLLEAINLALRCQLNRRSALQELHPFLLNAGAVQEFVQSHKDGKPQPPPTVLIELYFANTPELAEFKGTNNSEKADVPGVSFAGHPMSSRALPYRAAMIDPSAISNTYAANKYVLEIVRDYLTDKQKVDLALSYRKMRDVFLSDDNVAEINKELAGKTGKVTDKTLSVAMDTTTRASWETGVLPHLDDIPLTLVGKGEQNAIKIKLAIESESSTDILLLEEPENHLSHANLNKLINHIDARSADKQLIVTTHSSFVLNKLGVDHILMFNGKTGITLNELPDETKKYFMRLPGHDTLRMVLSARSILVEGPSDELIVQKAYSQTHGKMPLEDGVEVIAVNSLAFKRFLDIAKLLEVDARVVTDNDSDADAVTEKYTDYMGLPTIKICFDPDEAYPTLEPQLLKANGRAKLNAVLGKNFADDVALLDYMTKHKAPVALAIFESGKEIAIPDYIKNAIG